MVGDGETWRSEEEGDEVEKKKEGRDVSKIGSQMVGLKGL